MRRTGPLLPALALALLACAVPARALERPTIAAARATGPIRVDGRLDEADWARAAPVTAFRLIYNREGEAPSESTEVRILVDGTHVYVGARCWNRGPGALRASLAPRDQILDLDSFGLAFDTYRDRHRGYTFGVNPYGVQYDGIFSGDELDTQWDGVWDAEATRDSLGWTAELAIPLRTLRFPEGSGTWGVWMRRQIQKSDEICSWPLWRQSIAGDVMLQAADLTGLDGLKSGGLVDVQPYAASTWLRQRRPGEGPVRPGWSDDRKDDVGADVRVPLTSTLTMNATLNPDFSQIEADALQIDVNQRYPLYFEEKRPFFLEGADIFETPFDLIYTRRLADPAYGVKLSGRAGHVRVGGLVVRDDGGGSLSGIGGGPHGAVSEPGWFQVGRASWEIDENASVGVLAALHQTDGPSLLAVWDGFREDGGSNAVFAADARLRFTKHWSFEGQVAHSRSAADSAWSFVRLDGAGAGVDQGRARTRRSDVAYFGEFRYADGIRNLELYSKYLGPDFRAETGFLSRVDLRQTGVESNFYVRPQNAWLRSVQPILEGFVEHDEAGAVQGWWWSPMIDWKFQKQTHVHTMFDRWQERWLGRDYVGNAYILNVDNSQLRWLTVALATEVGNGIWYGESDGESSLGWLEQYTGTATVRPSPRVTAELSATRNRFSRDHGRGVRYDVWALGAKTTYQFTRRLYARLYPQYDTEERHLDADALVGYVLHPGSVLYLGYNGDADSPAAGLPHRATAHTMFFKVSYVFQR